MTSDYVEIAYFLEWSEFTDQNIQAKISTMAYLGIQGRYQLETFTSKYPWPNTLWCLIEWGLEQLGAQKNRQNLISGGGAERQRVV